MSSGFFNTYHHSIMDGSLDLNDAGTDIQMLLLRSTGSYTFDPDDLYVADIFTGGGVEISVTSYSRKSMANKSLAIDNTNDAGVADCDAIVFGALEVGQTVDAFVIFEQVTNDADSKLIAFFDGKSDLVAAAPVAASLTGSITAATKASQCEITSAAHGLSNGDVVFIEDCGGMTEINNLKFTVANVATDTFELSGIDSTGYTLYTSGGTFKQVMNVYVDRVWEIIVEGAAVDFGGGATGVVTEQMVPAVHTDITLGRVVLVHGLGAAVSAGDVSSSVDTAIGLPVALDGNSFIVTPGTLGWAINTNTV